MKNHRQGSISSMRKYYQLILVVVCCISVVSLLIYRHEYYRLRYVLEVLNIFGKPGLSEIEFCGAGFNATLLSELLANSSYDVKETPPLFQQLDENFYTYSSFLRYNHKYDQLSPGFIYETDTIAVAKSNLQPKYRCHLWYEDDPRPKNAKFSFKILIEVSGFQLYIFKCQMGKDFGQPVGISFSSNERKMNPLHAAISQLIPINTKKRAHKSSNIKFVNNVDILACVIPNEIPIVSKSDFIEFLSFYQMMGVRKFTIYDSMVTEDMIKRINMLPADLTKWRIKFYPMNYPFEFSSSYAVIRQVVQLDCTFRYLQTDKEVYNKVSHLVTLSWDEFLVPRYHNNVRSLLREYDLTRMLRSVEVSCLHFCFNQRDDAKSRDDLPKFFEKTHYYKISIKNTTVSILNLDSINSFDNIIDIVSPKNSTVPEDMLSVHKYSECTDGSTFSITSKQLDGYPHRFEGAMLKFADDFHNNKIYRLFQTGRIWEKTELVHDAL